MWPFSTQRTRQNSEARARVAEGALLLDVRSREEFAGGHVEGAVNIPVQELGGRLAEVGKAPHGIVVYCRSGARSSAAASLLRSRGFTVVDAGGMSDY